MATAQPVLYFLVVLGITAALLSLFFTYLRPQCSPYQANHYEHFANPSSAEIDQRLVKDLQTMIDTITPLQDTLEILMDSVGEMKANTCEIYDEFHVNYVQSRGSSAPDTSEYTLPAEQQVRRQESRMTYAEKQWNAKKEFFQSFYKLPTLLCESSTPKPIKPTPKCSTSKLTCTRSERSSERECPLGAELREGTNTMEGFALPSSDVNTLTYQLGEAVAPFQSVLTSSFGKDLVQDCLGITGTSLFINNQLQTILAGMNASAAPFEGQRAPTATAKTAEGFSNYPRWGPKDSIPFPPSVLNSDQQKAYTMLSDAQNVLDNFKSFQNGLYKGTVDAYTQLNNVYQQYLAYKGQMASGVQQLDSVKLTPPP